jgi:hypothetical protein
MQKLWIWEAGYTCWQNPALVRSYFSSNFVPEPCITELAGEKFIAILIAL